jgi:hypothetical protein
MPKHIRIWLNDTLQWEGEADELFIDSGDTSIHGYELLKQYRFDDLVERVDA